MNTQGELIINQPESINISFTVLAWYIKSNLLIINEASCCFHAIYAQYIAEYDSFL